MRKTKHLLNELIESVQLNCDLSDREFAADYSLCIYLIRMREYYRWVHQLSPNETLDQPKLMHWLSKTEDKWDKISASDYQTIVFQGKPFSPFDADPINQLIEPLGYTYSAGYGRFGKPVFLLAELLRVERNAHYSLRICGKEWARELSAPPATLQNNQILIRSEAVSRWIWDLVEEWQWKKPDNAMAEVMKCYDFERQPQRALKQAIIDQQEVLILHELGELLAEEKLAPHWNKMLLSSDHKKQLIARAVRDNLADCLSTLPGLLAEQHDIGIHFYFAGLTPLRKSLFPRLDKSYRSWRDSGSTALLKKAITQGQQHWLKTAQDMSESFSQNLSKPKEENLAMQSYIAQYAF